MRAGWLEICIRRRLLEVTIPGAAPGNEVAVPGVHDGLDGLFEEVAMTEAEPRIHADWTGLGEDRFRRGATDGRGLKGKGRVIHRFHTENGGWFIHRFQDSTDGQGWNGGIPSGNALTSEVCGDPKANPCLSVLSVPSVVPTALSRFMDFTDSGGNA